MLSLISKKVGGAFCASHSKLPHLPRQAASGADPGAHRAVGMGIIAMSIIPVIMPRARAILRPSSPFK